MNVVNRIERMASVPDVRRKRMRLQPGWISTRDALRI